MILIKHIEFIETDRDPIEILSNKGPYEVVEVLSDRGDTIVPVSVVSELVRGRRFNRPDGVELNIGVSKQAEAVLGIQYECWENMKKEADTMSKDLFKESLGRNKAERKLAKYEKAGFWKRLAYAINGMMD